jgi:hypothetical protein
MNGRMKQETPEQKWDRLQSEIHAGITKGYPNPDRKGCVGHESIVALAVRAADFDDTIEDDPQWQHVTHCSPCYSEYVEALKNQRGSKRSVKTK